MKAPENTIYALASASGRAGVAVVRISGEMAVPCAVRLTGIAGFEDRMMVNATFRDPESRKIIDEGLAVYFKGPRSFTGEDVVELHVHGGRAVVNAIFAALSSCDGMRMAEPGEFSRRAVLNGKFDLTAAEGLLDLINADTQAQRIYALRQKGGELKGLYEEWRGVILKKLAWVEAYIDFPEEDVPQDIMNGIIDDLRELADKISLHLGDDKGRKLREGFRIAIVGAPNAGKSSLLNLLTKRDAAIVSSTPGTTRDVIEVHMDIGGYPVIFSDTAGIRETHEEIEREGIRRAMINADNADLVLVLLDGTVVDADMEKTLAGFNHKEHMIIINKSDISQKSLPGAFNISAKTGQGIEALLQRIEDTVMDGMSIGEAPVLTRARHKEALTEAVSALERAISGSVHLDMMAEDVRLATRALGRITGQVLADEILDVIFKDFCIGK